MDWLVYDTRGTYVCYRAKLAPLRRLQRKWTNRWNHALCVAQKNERGKHALWMSAIRYHGDYLSVREIWELMNGL